MTRGNTCLLVVWDTQSEDSAVLLQSRAGANAHQEWRSLASTLTSTTPLSERQYPMPPADNSERLMSSSQHEGCQHSIMCVESADISPSVVSFLRTRRAGTTRTVYLTTLVPHLLRYAGGTVLKPCRLWPSHFTSHRQQHHQELRLVLRPRLY